MTAAIDSIIASARVVTPEEGARDRAELVLMKLALGVARMSGVPLHVVRFDADVTALVPGDPNDKEVWNNALAQIYKAATTGQVGPVEIDQVEKP